MAIKGLNVRELKLGTTLIDGVTELDISKRLVNSCGTVCKN